jgi:hypothetical protein
MKKKKTLQILNLATPLTENFTLAELVRSDKATERGYHEQFSPPDAVVSNLRLVCDQLLQPLRTHVGRPIKISSGYRAARTNAAVGGEFNSQHLTGQAVDFTIPGMSLMEIVDVVKELELPFDQLIVEFGRWIHISYTSRQRTQILIATKNKANRTIYTHAL